VRHSAKYYFVECPDKKHSAKPQALGKVLVSSSVEHTWNIIFTTKYAHTLQWNIYGTYNMLCSYLNNLWLGDLFDDRVMCSNSPRIVIGDVPL
jgi:hypothetical protein